MKNNFKRKKFEKERAKLSKLLFFVTSLAPSEKKDLLNKELHIAIEKLESNNNFIYARHFRKQYSSIIFWSKINSFFSGDSRNSNMQLVLLGIICYSIIILFIGICAGILVIYSNKGNTGFRDFLDTIWLGYIFKTLSDLGFTTRGYYLGVLGGAGAVVSMVRRFNRISTSKKSKWLIFADGFFNPIVGSLSAVIVCKFVEAGLLNILEKVPIIVIAFFSGFSERLLETVGREIQLGRKTPSKSD